MLVDELRVEPTPDGERVRLLAEVQYERGSPAREICWFEVPAAYEPELSRSGNPWLACLLAVAVHLGEPLRLALPVDRVLLNGAQDLMRVWATWYPHLQPIPLEATTSASVSVPTPYREACFFSGGVDSSFSVLQRIRTHVALPPYASAAPSLELLSIHGTDVRLDREVAQGRMTTSAREVAEAYGCHFVPISTNLRQTRFREAPWGRMSHGGLLAGVGLALEGRYRRAIISSSFDFADQHPWGSHPLTDPLFSTSTLQVEHCGCRYRRAEKIAALAAPEGEPLLRRLRVCYHNQRGLNCGACRKCFRVMAVLEMVGVLEQCDLFPPDVYSVKRLGRVYTPPSSRSLLASIRDFAQKQGRQDVVLACDESWRISCVARPLVELAEGLRKHPQHRLTRKRLHRYLSAHLVL